MFLISYYYKYWEEKFPLLTKAHLLTNETEEGVQQTF